MFSRKKAKDAVEQQETQINTIVNMTMDNWTKAARGLAIDLIEEEIEQVEGKSAEAYIKGLVDMAYKLQVITMNERADYSTRAHEKERAAAAKGEPVYKKKGVYEYNGYYILKDLAIGAGSCWSIQKIGSAKVLAKELAFKDAVTEIDKLNK